MKHMKQILAAAMTMTMTLSMTACGGSTDPESTPAQNGEQTEYKVGIVQYVDHASLNQIVASIEQRLDERGAELGVTFNYQDYFQNAQGDGSVTNQIAADLIADDVDVIVPIASPVAVAMQTATEENQIPVVFSAVSDPVFTGLAESMEAPGSNLTGTSDALDTNTIMDLIFAADPDCDYVGLLYDLGQDSSTQPIADAKAYLDSKGIKYVEKTGSTTDEVLMAAQSLVTEGVDAVFTPTDNTIMTAELTIYETFLHAGIPHYAGADTFALNGGFLGYGVDYENLGIMTADMIVDVLVNGADPATTPIQTFDSGIATINTEACRALGFDMETLRETFGPYCTKVQEVETAENFE